MVLCIVDVYFFWVVSGNIILLSVFSFMSVKAEGETVGWACSPKLKAVLVDDFQLPIRIKFHF